MSLSGHDCALAGFESSCGTGQRTGVQLHHSGERELLVRRAGQRWNNNCIQFQRFVSIFYFSRSVLLEL